MQDQVKELREAIIQLKLESPWDPKLPKLIQQYDNLTNVQPESTGKVK